MNITCRNAAQADLPALAAMNRELIEDEGSRTRLDFADLTERMAGWLQGGYAAAIFESHGQTLAYALWRPDGDAVYLRQFFVQREHRRRGVGRACIHILLHKVLPGKRIVLEVLTTNPGGLAFWKSVGFVEYSLTLERNPM